MTFHSSSHKFDKFRSPEPAAREQLVLLGLNYHGSPVAIRERYAIPDTCLFHALNALKQLPSVKESAVLSTCNRTEVYAVVTDVDAGLIDLQAFFRHAQAIPDHDVLKPDF